MTRRLPFPHQDTRRPGGACRSWIRRSRVGAHVSGWAVAALLLPGCLAPAPEGDGGDARPEAAAEPGGVEEAVWSADGRRLAVTWAQPGGTRLVGLFGPVDGAPPQQGTGLPLADGEAGWGSWAPDGLWVAYAAGPEGARDIHRARPDGTGAEALTGSESDDFDPAYSPDGRTLAFVSDRDGGVPRLHVMPAGGGEARLLADLGGPVRRPMWAPDGRRLAVQVTEAGEEVIYLVAADGGGWGRLGAGSLPAWAPAGDRVAFMENDSLFWRPVDGGLRRFIVPDGAAPRFSPDGDWLAFVRSEGASGALYLLHLETMTATRVAGG